MGYILRQFIFILALLGLVTACGGDGGGGPGGGEGRGKIDNASSLSKIDFEPVAGAISTDSFLIGDIDATLQRNRGFFTRKLVPGPASLDYGFELIVFIDSLLSTACPGDPTFVKNIDGSFRIKVYRDASDFLKCGSSFPSTVEQGGWISLFIDNLILLGTSGNSVDLSMLTRSGIPPHTMIAQITYKHVLAMDTNTKFESREYKMIASISNNNAPCKFNLSLITDCMIAKKFTLLDVVDIEKFEYQNVGVPTFIPPVNPPDHSNDFDRLFTSGLIRFQFHRLQGAVSYPTGTYSVSDGNSTITGQL